MVWPCPAEQIMDWKGPLPACGQAQDSGKAAEKLVGGPERGPVTSSNLD